VTEQEKPFVAMICGANDQNLQEVTLWGHDKRSFLQVLTSKINLVFENWQMEVLFF